ncbi:MAG: (Fe-S)-binding protein [Archaeoglobaceae archaeon]|nr:(Fe-S)-binding protein [Archaeoglobaceae archaeon]MDW8118922.1 (Fe-S)-binding protein [Archaeoglobaceae archaeon]
MDYMIPMDCIKCGLCNICPVFRVERSESVSPRGKIILLSEIKRGSIKLDARIVKEIYKCSVCGVCSLVCPANLDLIKLWEEVREEFVNKKIAPLPIHRKVRDITYREFNPYGGDQQKRAEWLDLSIEKSRTLYFAGCTASFKAQNIAKATAKTLKNLGIEFTVLGAKEFCCGSPFLRTGQIDVAKMLFTKNIKVWQSEGIKEIITSCPGCYKSIKEEYPKFAKEVKIEFNIEVKHISSVFAKLMKKEGKLELIATYHDPCHLGRHMGVYEEPREVIRKAGIKLVEMERNREFSLCCGAGGGLRTQFKEIAMAIAEERIREALETGTNVIITSCPFCEYNLSRVGGSRVRVLDLSEIAEKTISP